MNFIAEPGEMIALVGHTGSGKTSIINLIAKFYLPTSGQLLIDGRDIRQITGESLHRQIGIVLQNNFLFSDSVLENIRVGRPDATDAEVLDAVRRLDCLDLVEGLPEGIATAVGERGGNLSLGPAASGLLCPRDAGRPADSDSRRSHQQRRYADRSPHPTGVELIARRPHELRDRPSAQHGASCRSCAGARRRATSSNAASTPSWSRWTAPTPSFIGDSSNNERASATAAPRMAYGLADTYNCFFGSCRKDAELMQ